MIDTSTSNVSADRYEGEKGRNGKSEKHARVFAVLFNSRTNEKSLARTTATS